MEILNVIPINEIISIIMLVFLSIIAILIYSTLKEMRNKKRPCNLPNIFVKYNTNITYDIKNIRNENSKINISIQNNGNGMPKDINGILVVCDINKRKFENMNIVKDTLFYTFKDYYGVDAFNSASTKDFFIEALPSDVAYKINTNGIEHTIRCMVKSVIEAHTKNMSEEKILEEWEKLQIKLLLKVCYKDSIENLYDISFHFKLTPNEISYEDKTITYTLEIDSEEVEEK